MPKSDKVSPVGEVKLENATFPSGFNLWFCDGTDSVAAVAFANADVPGVTAQVEAVRKVSVIAVEGA